MDIHSFEALYASLAESLYHAGYGDTVKRHDSRLFIVEMEAHYSFRIYERTRTDGRNVCLEVLHRNRRRKRFFLDYTGAYSYVMEKAVKFRRQTLQELENRRLLRKRLASCSGGGVLILFPAFLIFAIWLSRSSDSETPLYVYLALTFAFGILVLCGIGTIWSELRSRADQRGIDKSPAGADITEIPLSNISNIARSSIYYVDESLTEQDDYSCLSPFACAAAWYQKYHPPKAFSFIRRIRNRYIGNRVWRIGGISYLAFYDGNEEIRFTIAVPKNPASEEYRLAREKWEAVTCKIQSTGWLLFDET